MGCIIKHSDSQSTSNKEDGIVSALPLLYSSSICNTENKTALHLSVTTLSPDIHSDEDEKEVEVSGEKLSDLRFEPDVSGATGNVNLFSVTFKPFGSEEYEEVLDEEEVCKPLLRKVQKEEIQPSVQTEIKTDDPITKGSKNVLVCSYPDIQTNQDTRSDYTLTTTEGMHEQDCCLSEETDNCDTSYIMR